eukprot:GFKZ01012996.1.p3 GENE.GFKZ01012996.1~~GFKZ01012996.1.p3  ORF type:complete len:208 (+),score=8.46 GFKZ01012996.1:316-939(+)
MPRPINASESSLHSIPRLFVGLALPEPVAASLETLVQPTRLPHARWMPPTTWHITLHFLGATLVTEAQSALGTVRADPFELQVNSVGTFGSSSRPRILWAGVESNPGLLSLHAAIGERLNAARLRTDRRPYSPHITIAKVRCKCKEEEDMLQTFAEENHSFESPSWRVGAFTLYESVRTSSGTTYISRGEYPISGDTCPQNIPDLLV